MEILTALIFLSLKRITECNISIGEADSRSTSQAANEISKRYFVEMFTNIRIITSVDQDKRMKAYDLVTDLIKLVDMDLKVTIEEPQIIKFSNNKRGSPTVIIINSMKSFKKIQKTFVFDNMRFRKYYVLIFLDGFFHGVEEVFKGFWDYWIFNVVILSANENGTIGLFTFFPFANGKCGNDLTVTRINLFNSTTNSWSTDNFFTNKFDNLNQCKLKIATLGSSMPSVMRIETPGSKHAFHGLEVDIVDEIASEFNASVIFEDFETIGTVYENGTATTGMLPSVYKKTHDAAIGTLSLQYDRAQFLSETKSFLSVAIILVMPPTRMISPFSKLARPFTILVWILLTATFFIGFVIIVVLNSTSKRAYKFVVGNDVNYPFLNMLIAFFGGTQNKLPQFTFARYLLMKFLLFCLVIRCLYQGKLYIMLQMNLFEKQAETIDDLMERGMTFYTYESLSKRVEGFKFAKKFGIIRIAIWLNFNCFIYL